MADALCSHLDAETVDYAKVVVSELVTNAVIHANTAVTVGLTLLPEGGARIEVGDASSWPPTPRAATYDAPSGRGLLLVDALAKEWGVIPSQEGKTVWAELEPAERRSRTLVDHG